MFLALCIIKCSQVIQTPGEQMDHVCTEQPVFCLNVQVLNDLFIISLIVIINLVAGYLLIFLLSTPSKLFFFSLLFHITFPNRRLVTVWLSGLKVRG